MLLRRLIQHVREQNWTAIGIEFVIVVVGVFVGIEVSNWNQERADRNREIAFLGQLRDEMADNVVTIEHQLRYQAEVIASGRRALAFLQSDGNCAAECPALLIDLFHASQFWGTPYARAKYEENQRLGFPTTPATRAAVDEFYSFIDGWDAVTAAAPPYRERVRGHFGPDASEALWGGCWRSSGGRLEELTRDCVSDLDALDAKAMLVAIHADGDLAPGLRFWLGQNIFAAGALPQAVRHAEVAIAAINDEQERGR
jgi:hypothetical protein